MDSGNPKAASSSPQEAQTLEQEQIVFHDADPGEEEYFPSSSVSAFDTSGISGVSLGDFISRPVLIDTTTWAENTYTSHIFDPWSLFLTNPTIKKKLDNYALIRCNLHVKFILSASPFYYGALLASYNPTPDTHTGPNVIIGGNEQMVTLSQRPHIWMYPSESAGGSMELPFFYDYNWLRNRTADIARMGTITYSTSDVLRNANSTAGANVTIRCYAWATNVELSAPTLVLQSKRSSKTKMKKAKPKVSAMDRVTSFGMKKDEYGDGPVSGIASAVAAASSALSSVPIIGPFARATEIGAGVVSRMASWFGYTNVPVISNIMPFKNMPFGGFPSSEIGAPTEKLTLDPKNELTLDSRTVGLDGTDELSIEHFSGIKSFYDRFLMDTSDAPNTILHCIAVTPNMTRRNGSNCWPTPMAHVASMYQYWTGDIIYSFKIVATPYHRGRIKIQYEPSRDINLGALPPLDETALITRIYDIGDTEEIEICVPYMQAEAFTPSAEYRLDISAAPSPTQISSDMAAVSNGFLFVSVANELTSPVADAPIIIIMSVRAGPNFKVMGPRAVQNDISWTSQSKVTWDCAGETDDAEPALNLVYGGETALSLRQLLHRHCYVRSYWIPSASNVYNTSFSMYPLSLNAFTSLSRNIHNGAVTSERYNYVTNSYVAWLSPCFAGRRGSMYWAFNGGDRPAKTYVARLPQVTLVNLDYDQALVNSPPIPELCYANMHGRRLYRIGNGASVCHTRTQNGVTALVPFISNRRFHGTFPSPFVEGGATRPYVADETVGYQENLGLGGDTLGTDGDIFCASGPDFNLFFFVGVPTLSIKSLPLPDLTP